MSKDALISRIRTLRDHFTSGAIPRPAQHEVHPDMPASSRERYLYFTLPVTINFQRSSPAMWQSAYTTWHDPETQPVFLPEWVAAHSEDELRAKLTKHKLALQPNKHTTIWRTIALTLHEFYSDDPREFLKSVRFDIPTLISHLQIKHRRRFPYLSGPKLSNYWPYILSQYTDAQFANVQALSIIPDTHVIQSSIRLGLVPANATSRDVEQVWRELLKGTDITPSQLHPVLWHWSRNHFQPAG
ncbi:hypothetical protein HY374_02380 [Candidatus Berkelbacteria bacterium]|nr:hypothetical protein [Candidatus Berkelbacteria bacterium]